MFIINTPTKKDSLFLTIVKKVAKHENQSIKSWGLLIILKEIDHFSTINVRENQLTGI